MGIREWGASQVCLGEEGQGPLQHRAQPAPNSLADEGPLGDGLQSTNSPAHLGCSVELQSNPGVGERRKCHGGN